jgi:phage repressor protein C with HTH and peptisase S24 domain
MEYKGYMGKIYLKNLSRLLDEKKMSQETLARKIGVEQPYISKLATLKQAGPMTVAYQIADALGEKIGALTGKADATPPLSEIRVVWDSARFPVKEPAGRFEDNFLPVPVYNVKVVGGDPESIAREEVEDVALIHRSALKRKTTRGLVCTFVLGDSMIPILREGAIVCIDTTLRPDRGKVPRGSIWAVRKEDGVVVKFLQLADGAIVLVSANPDFPPELVSSPDAIVGRVIWVWQAV